MSVQNSYGRAGVSALHLIRHGAVAELKLDNPAKLNAFTRAMLAALEGHCAALEFDDEIRAVVITAEKARAFCAGADIAEWGALSPRDFSRHWVREGNRIFDRLARLSKPVIGAINGHVFGGGLEFAACCDVRVIAPGATLALPEAGIGVVPGWSGTQRLTRLIGEPAVKEMALFGARLSAERAAALGFVSSVEDEPEARAFEMAQKAAASSPRALEIAKMMIHAGAGEDRSTMIDALAGGAAGAADDCAEGVASFREKRRPGFTGV